VLLFALCWFLGGHLLESSFIPLELYFEHRNYLPSIGPLFAICFYLWSNTSRLQLLLRYFLVTYAVLLIFLLRETAQTWSQPTIAAQLWVQEHPFSKRAHQYLSMQYTAQGDHIKSTETIVNAYKKMPQSTGLALQVLQLECNLGILSREVIDEVTSSLDKGDLDLSTMDTLDKLIILQNQGRCPELTLLDIHKAIFALINNPSYQASSIQLANLYIGSALLYRKQRNLNLTIENLDMAAKLNPDLQHFLLIAGILLDAGLYDEALKQLDNALSNLPKNPLIREKWIIEISNLQKNIQNDMKDLPHKSIAIETQ
jgi:tetratricopeptide (TPR) repeat protein